jgi:hypothetical protein
MHATVQFKGVLRFAQDDSPNLSVLRFSAEQIQRVRDDVQHGAQ